MAVQGIAKRSQKYATPIVQQELAGLEETLGGRQALVGLLVLAPLTDELRYVLGLLGDPKNLSKPLAVICAQGNILPGELLRHLLSAALLKGKVLASQQIGNGIAAVTADVMRRAAPFEETCHACGGTCEIMPEPTPEQPNPTKEPCSTCNATGTLRYLPALDRQKLALDLGQLLPTKGAGIQILNQQNQGGGTGGGALGRLQEMSDRILYGDRGALPGPDLPPADLEAGEETVEGERVEEQAEEDQGIDPPEAEAEAG